ncbi:MAG: malonyl CoA-acyl carrier protein transacylase [Pirellulaceae bacterium]|nr:MAG: malonyl CoA-acyl carrier protein transacylase [Pirellulaceae bacterium]GIW96534.1 MAG: malonyl CoA-acyl carrier protein transacylase [Pirellulaceae bacterium]
MKRVGFLFPGQGAQFVGMGRVLVESLPQARQLFDQAREILGYDLAQLCLEGPSDKLDSTVHSQPALFVTSLAALEFLRVNRPDYVAACGAVAGLSLGEFTALTVAGVMDFATGLRIVQRRGEAMQRAADMRPSGMVSVLGLPAEQVEQLCQEVVQPGEVLRVANYLCPGNTVVSGDRAACQRLAEAAVAKGAMRTVPLAVAGAFHTELMAPAMEGLRQVLESAELRPARIPVYANVDAQPHQDPEEIRQLLIRQLVSPVRWEASMRRMLADGIEAFHEIGPGRVLSGLLKRIDRKIGCETIAC